jgi:FkbM family methyltransferase
MSNALFTPQMYEVAERAQLAAEIEGARACGRTFVFVDAGANVGLFSLFVASHVGAHAKVLAIEPEPQNLNRLRFNVAANPGVPITVIATALGETTGRVALEVDGRDRGGTRTRPLTQLDHADAPQAECRALLDVLRQEGITYVDALKIDVEGAEDRILVPFFANAPSSLWPTLLIIEDARAAWRTDLFSGLADRGYEVAARTKLNVMMRRTAR